MRVSGSLLEVFEKAVEPDVDTLRVLAGVMAERAMAVKEKQPDTDMWNIPEGEMQHCINGALQNLMYASMGDLNVVSNGLDRYIPRIEDLEKKLGQEANASIAVRSIKDKVDAFIAAPPQP